MPEEWHEATSVSDWGDQVVDQLPRCFGQERWLLNPLNDH